MGGRNESEKEPNKNRYKNPTPLPPWPASRSLHLFFSLLGIERNSFSLPSFSFHGRVVKFHWRFLLPRNSSNPRTLLLLLRLPRPRERKLVDSNGGGGGGKYEESLFTACMRWWLGKGSVAQNRMAKSGYGQAPLIFAQFVPLLPFLPPLD